MALKILDQLSVKMQRMRTKIDEFLANALGINDASRARLFKVILDVAQDQFQLSTLYQAQSHKQLAPQTATKDTSIRGLARVSGHSATRPISARGSVTLRKNAAFSVGSYLYVAPTATLKCATNNLIYTVNIDTEKRYSLTNNAIPLPLIQGQLKTQTFVVDATSQDTALYTVRLEDQEYIEHYSVKVKVNGEIWDGVDSILDMAEGSTTYWLDNGWQSQVRIIFGDETHSTELRHGDLIEIEYLVTQGEAGILSSTDEFTIIDGFTNVNGDELTDFIIKRESGFLLASNGENSEVTRNLIGYSSRAKVFAAPENLQAYLSRLSILSHIDVWAEKNNDLITHVLALPRLSFLNARDYLNITEDRFKLTEAQKTDIKALINNSSRQFPSSEIIMEDPVLKRYAVFVYVEGNVDDTDSFKNNVRDALCELVLEATYKSRDMRFDNKIVKAAMETEVFSFDEVTSVQIGIFSEENEQAKSDGFYFVDEVTTDGTSRIVTNVRKELSAGENPNIGLNSLNDIVVNNGEIPILRPISLYNNGQLTALNNAINIFLNVEGIWKQL